MPEFGPGTLQIGETGSEIDCSCLVNSFTIAMTKNKADDKTKLCGTVKPGAITYTYAATGNLDVDCDDPTGIFALSQENAGEEVPFTYTPSTAGGTVAAGILILDPMDFGGEEYGADMASDVEWSLVDKPTYTYPEETPPARNRFARRVRDGKTYRTTKAPAADQTKVLEDA